MMRRKTFTSSFRRIAECGLAAGMMITAAALCQAGDDSEPGAQTIAAEAIPTDTGDRLADYPGEFLAIAQVKGLDANFVRFSGEADVGEVLLGQLGEQQAQNGDLKQFCQDMMTGHEMAYEGLKPLARQLTVEVPKATSLINAIAFLKLKTLHGADFDKQLALEFVKSHAMALGGIKKAEPFIRTPEARMLADKESPMVLEHFKKAAQVAKALGSVTGRFIGPCRKYCKGWASRM